MTVRDHHSPLFNKPPGGTGILPGKVDHAKD